MGSTYLDHDLEEGEEVRYRTKLHWITFRWSSVFILLAIYIGRIDKGLPFAMAIMSFALVLHVIALVIVRYSELKVTDRRLILRVGFIGRLYDSIPFEEIDDLWVEGKPVGDKLGYGTFVVEWGDGNMHSVDRVKGAADFLAGVEEVRRAFVPPAVEGGEPEENRPEENSEESSVETTVEGKTEE